MKSPPPVRGEFAGAGDRGKLTRSGEQFVVPHGLLAYT